MACSLTLKPIDNPKATGRGTEPMPGGYIRSALLVLATVLAYANSFDVGFEFDDYGSIVNNPRVSQTTGAINADSVPDPFIEEFHARRPLGFLSFKINYRLHGLEVWGYHAVNLLVHLASVLLVYAFVLLLFKTPRARDSIIASRSGTVAFLCAALFALHSIQTQAVTYIVQRFTSMAAMFYLASLVLYLNARLSARPLPRYAAYALSVLAALAAMATKEIALTLPFAAALVEFVFFPGEPARKRMAWLAALMLTVLVIPITIYYQQAAPSGLMEFAMTHSRLDTDISRSTYFFTQLRVIVTYLRLLVLPINQNLDYDYPTYENFFVAPVLLSGALLLAIFALGIYMLRRRDGAFAVMGFGVLWFFLTMSIESSFLPIVDVIFEHRVYLPSVGLFCAAVVGASYVSAHGKRFNYTVAIILISACVLGIMTHNRNETWRDSIRLWQDTVSKSPNKARPHFNLALYYYKKKDYEPAIEHFKRAVEADPWEAQRYNGLGVAYYSAGNDDLAIASYLKALELEPNFLECMVNLAMAYNQKGQYEKALYYYQKVRSHAPQDFDVNLSIARLQYATGRWDDAAFTVRYLLTLKPGDSQLNGMLADIVAKKQLAP